MFPETRHFSAGVVHNYILAQKQQKIISQGGPTNAYFAYFRWCEWCGEIHINPKSV
ncbi:hypothetical protein QFX17_06195 [Lactobacillus helveticus]|uniref:hypothetical protein n=1 Tax=Lactobacillus helveticus TaxID=1587 RepID=UPI0021C2E1F9|nr:hypothetical protein [Lactobacillus helveticus]MCO0808437.1 hypothetical protein [Lactobacillus helveticus]MCP9317599.1 hypothetical protein [Lactobacillus helveticus]MDH5817823.1 hypothetical protein [Lactobacillus helveticus]